MFYKWKKRKHFKKQASVLEKKMWDIEFLKAKMKIQREEFRREYDRIGELLDASTKRLDEEKLKEDPDKTIVENLTKYQERYQPDLEQLKTQIESIDTQIEGTHGSNSLNETMEGYRMVIKMLGDFRKKI